MSHFKLTCTFEPQGDQREAIDSLTKWLKEDNKYQTLLGVTGSGKTFTIANVIHNIGKPTLILTHNKTLAAQLYEEFKTFFPDNAVEYFVSYYDYYQPEAYIPTTDIYIEKDTSVNETIDKLRHRATYSLFERNDVIIIASVSCIYGLGSPEAYTGMMLHLETGKEISREIILKKLIEIQYERSEYDFHRGTFRVKGDIIEVFPAYEEDIAVRITLFGDFIENIYNFDPITGKTLTKKDKIAIYPSSHYVATELTLKNSVSAIKEELKDRLQELRSQNKILEAARLEQRCNYDIEFLQEMGYCKGIENYSRYITNRKAGEQPPTLLDYFPKDYLLVIDESHVTIPQLHGMYRGDRARKETLVDYGFRLPSALDNRPLKFEEFENMINQIIFVSATPSDYEIKKSSEFIVEQIIRPTGLLDPQIVIKPAKNQIDDLIGEINSTIEKGFRVLVTTLTKRMAENLTDYLKDMGIKAIYLHSEIDTLQRIEIIRELRKKSYDVLVGINLLREGLDIPEVALVAILDADKEGFLRSETSLIQTIGRTARNSEGRAILYADVITRSIENTVKETERRRAKQIKYNIENGITPQTINKKIAENVNLLYMTDYFDIPDSSYQSEDLEKLPKKKLNAIIKELEANMKKAANNLEFEEAAKLRDRIIYMRNFI